MQMAEGQLSSTPWYPRLDDQRKREFRELSRKLLAGLMAYLNEENEAALNEAKMFGEEYQRLGRQAGLSLSDTVRLFLFFRDFLYDSVVDVYQASGQRAPREWARMHREVASYTNAVLIALVEAHERAEKSHDRRS
jgi:hypothetical protein